MSPHMSGSIALSFRGAAKRRTRNSNPCPTNNRVCANRKASWLPGSGLRPAPGWRWNSVALRVFQLLEPVEADLLDDPAVDHDDARLVPRVGVEMLVDAIRRNVDEIALLPVVALGLTLPLEFHRIVDVEPHVPVQVVALALDHVDHLFREMPVLARRLPGRQELHVDV